MLKKIVYILFLFISINTFATHNRAGEITFKHVAGLTYEITVTTYTKDSSPADRPSLAILWGDNSSLDSVPRITKILLGNDINQNTYIGLHTYPGSNPTPYIISIEDPNRNAGSLNIPNSVNIPFYLETELLINPFLGINNSPDLLNPPIDNACVGVPFIHNPGAVDTDGDSLFYSIQQSLGQGGQNIPNYQFPVASSSLTINGFTGDLIWNSPTQIGEHNVAILIEEFRNGIRIGSVLRDLQITVISGCPPPPIITGVSDTCVIAGETLDFNINATGTSAITLSATGLPFTVPNNATFQQITNPSTNTTANFNWPTACNNVRNSQYFISFKATSSGSSVPLINFLTTTISVIGPPPLNLAADVQSNAIDLSWDQYFCSQITGYKVYRRQGSSGFVPGPCETGLPSNLGYQLITTVSSSTTTSFTDNNNGLGLIPGEDYCYRIVACFPDGAESIVSDETCAQLRKDVPIITNVSVNNTSPINGSIDVAWSKPTEFDSVQFPGPYRYLIYRGEQSNTNLVLIDSTASINDTTYTDTLINTQDFQYFYRVDIYNLTSGSRGLIGISTVASSVFLNLTPSDNRVTLVWNEDVPWTNTEHVIFRQNPITLSFDSIDITTNSSYIDSNLANGTTYCYKVRSIGNYTTTNVISPIINYSQENCAIPFDNVLPCPPILSVTPNCDLFQNFLSWENQNDKCSDDILGYNIYKKDFINDQDYILLTSISNNSSQLDTTFLEENLSSIAGCYLITSIDSAGNESPFSDSVCVDNCPIYTLPNVFTPGSDGLNDLYIPFPYRFVESIKIEIFNRWGLLVFETTDPDILWDGTNKTTNELSADGTYFYVCVVNEIFLEGIRPRVLKGFITLINNQENSQP